MHKGYALVDIFQPCITFNKINTWQWFKEHTYYLEDSHDPRDRSAAFKRALETDKLPLGIFYINPNKSPFEDNVGIYQQDNRPLFEREPDMNRLRMLIGKFRAPANRRSRELMKAMTANSSADTSAAKPEKLRALFEGLYKKYNRKELIKPDPLQFIYRYNNPADMEIVGLLSACLAYGRVEQIQNDLNNLLGRMGSNPYEFVTKFHK